MPLAQCSLRDLRIFNRRVVRGGRFGGAWLWGPPVGGTRRLCEGRVSPGSCAMAAPGPLSGILLLSPAGSWQGENCDASSRADGFAALAKCGCFGEGPDCAGGERPCPAPTGPQIEQRHGDMLRVASGCRIRCWEQPSSNSALSCGN